MTDVANKDGLLALAHTERSMFQPADRLQPVVRDKCKFTQPMRARVLRDEIRYRLQHLADLLSDVRRGPDDPEQLDVIAIASAVEHLRAAVDAIDQASGAYQDRIN